MATVSLDVETKRLGKNADTIDRADLGPLADNLRDALRLVVGQDLAEAAASKVRQLA